MARTAGFASPTPSDNPIRGNASAARSPQRVPTIGRAFGLRSAALRAYGLARAVRRSSALGSGDRRDHRPLGHLDELRSRLIVVLSVLAVGAVARSGHTAAQAPAPASAA